MSSRTHPRILRVGVRNLLFPKVTTEAQIEAPKRLMLLPLLPLPPENHLKAHPALLLAPLRGSQVILTRYSRFDYERVIFDGQVLSEHFAFAFSPITANALLNIS